MSNSPHIPYVVFHTRCPTWKLGIDFREHIQHYLKLHEQSKLQFGGPFLMPDMGGMMITTKQVSQEELEAFAAVDPAVQAALLNYEIRPWLTAIEHQ